MRCRGSPALRPDHHHERTPRGERRPSGDGLGGGVGAGAGEPQWAGLSLEDVRIRLMVMVHDVAIDRQRAQKKESRMMRLITGPTATVRRWMNPRRATDDDAIRTAIREGDRDALPQVIAATRETDALAESLERAREHALAAQRELGVLPASTHRDALFDLADYAVMRLS